MPSVFKAKKTFAFIRVHLRTTMLLKKVRKIVWAKSQVLKNSNARQHLIVM